LSSSIVDLTSCQSLYDRGRFVDAYRELLRVEGIAEPSHADLVKFTTVPELVLACRICFQLEFGTTACLLMRRMWQLAPDDPKTLRYRLYYLEGRMRWIEAWELSRTTDRPPGADDEETALWLTACSDLAGFYRDFETAHQQLETATNLQPDDPWYRLKQAQLVFAQDRHKEAHDMVVELAAENPDSFHIQACLAELQHDLDEIEVAEQTFRSACEKFQSPGLHAGLSNCLIESGRPEEARKVLENLLEVFPLQPRGYRQGIELLLTRVSRMCGDHAGALDHGRKTGRAAKKVVAALERPEASALPRRQLNVPFRRQDHVGCAPATISAILAFFDSEIDKRRIAEAITYDGTPDYMERRWCVDQGLIYRSFQFDPDVCRDLIDRGLPFTLSTRFPLNAHQQAVIGYDLAMKTWILREPGIHAVIEIEEEALLDIIRPRGASAVLIVPEQERHRLPEEPLPLEAETLACLELRQALHEHRHEDACAAYERMTHLPPCPLLWDATRALRWYESDHEGFLATTREQVEAYPDDQYCLELLVNDLLRNHLWAEHRALLEKRCKAPGPPANLLIHLAETLGFHAPTHDRARRLALRACRLLPRASQSVSILAGILWAEPSERGRALELRRIASCMDPFREDLAFEYFEACDQLGRRQEGLAHLEDRVARYGGRSPWPAGSLARAHAHLYRRDQAVSVLRAALAEHEDPWVRGLLFDQLLSVRDGTARDFLAQSRGKMNPLQWHMSRYRLELRDGKPQAAKTALDEAVALRPEDESIQRAHLAMVESLEGRNRCREETLALLDRSGKDPQIARLCYDMLVQVGEPERAEQVVRDLIEQNPDEDWLEGLLARHLIRRGRVDEALPLCNKIIEIYPHSVAAWNDLGDALSFSDDKSGAVEAYRSSLRLVVDQPDTILNLVQNVDDAEQCTEQLRWIATQFHDQDPGSAGLHTFLEIATDVLDESEILELLDQLETEFPNDPNPGEELCEWLLTHEQVEQARKRAADLTERFPWRPYPSWLLARSLLALGETDAGRKQLETLTSQHPRYVQAWLELGESYQSDGELQRAEEVFARAAAMNPGDEHVRGYLADLAWQRGRVDDALAAIERAIEIGPGYEWALMTRGQWLVSLGRGAEALAKAEAHAKAHPTFAASHNALSKALKAAGRHEASVDAMQRALQLDPRLGSTRFELIDTLGQLGRLEEAGRVLREGFVRLGPTVRLRRLEAWLERLAGDHDSARLRLRKLLEEHPDFASGWVTYLSWLEEDGATNELLALANLGIEELDELPTFHGYLADAWLARGMPERARVALQRAIELAPDYDWARNRLGGLLRDLRESRAADDLYVTIKDPDTVSPETAGHAAMAFARRGNREQVHRFGMRVMRARDATQYALTLVYGAFDILAPKRAEREIGKLIENDRATTLVNWIILLGIAGKKAAFFAALDAMPRDEKFEFDLACILEQTHEGELASEWAEWIRRHVKPPIADVQLWGVIGVAGLEPDEVVEYMFADYRREGAEAWMLANLSEKLLLLERFTDMREVSEYAMASLPRDYSWWGHRGFVAYAYYEAGDYAKANEYAQVSATAWFSARFTCLAVQLLASLAPLRSWSDRRQLVRSRMPELLACIDVAAERGHDLDETGFWKRRLWKACRCDLTFLLYLGRAGRWLLRRLVP